MLQSEDEAGDKVQEGRKTKKGVTIDSYQDEAGERTSTKDSVAVSLKSEGDNGPKFKDGDRVFISGLLSE